MAKSAQDYPVTNPYNDTSPPYSNAQPHKGVDLGSPMKTYLFHDDNRVLTGKSGSYLGQTYAPHVHIQAGKDFYAQKPIDPTNYAFRPGEVVQVGWGDQWGTYIIVKTGSVYVVYAHLYKADVEPGDIIGDEMYKGKSAEYWHNKYQRALKSRDSYRNRLVKVLAKVGEILKLRGKDK